VAVTNLTMTLPARAWVVLKADKSFTPALTKKQLSVTLNPPALDFDTPRWLGVSATVPGNDFETVTFSIRLPGKPWSSLGSTDRRTFGSADVTGGLYRTYIHPQDYKAGTTVQLIATVKDALGNVATSKILTYKVNYSG